MPNLREAFSFKNNIHTLLHRQNSRFAFLDGWRFIGIFLVICGHCFMYFQDLYGQAAFRDLATTLPLYMYWPFNGDVAVDGFLVISAFLMTNILLKQHEKTGSLNFKVFYLSRFMRLTPAYLLALLCYVPFHNMESKDWILNLFYLQNFSQNQGAIYLPFTWSLAVEEQFYLLLPAFLGGVLLVSKYPFRWLFALFVASCLVRFFIVLNDEILATYQVKEILLDRSLSAHYFVTLYDNLYTRFGAFVCGIAIAFLNRYHATNVLRFMHQPLGKLTTHISLLVIVVTLSLPYMHADFNLTHSQNIFWQIFRRNILSASLAWLILVGVSQSNLTGRLNAFLSLKLFYPFGHLLYSMYLFHYLAVGFVLLNMHANLNHFGLDFRDNLLLWYSLLVALSFVGTMLLAILSFLLIEAPIMNLRPKMASAGRDSANHSEPPSARPLTIIPNRSQFQS